MKAVLLWAPEWGIRCGLVLSVPIPVCRQERSCSPLLWRLAGERHAWGLRGGGSREARRPCRSRVCYSWAWTKGGLAFCTFHVASFKIEIHLKWFGFFFSPPGVCCREITFKPRRCYSMPVPEHVQRNPETPHQAKRFHQRRPWLGPCLLLARRRFSVTPFTLPPSKSGSRVLALRENKPSLFL